MTHWKQNFDYKFTGAYELQPGEERTLTINKTAREEVKNIKGEKKPCFVAYFTESSKPMVLNKTNCKTIAKLYGSDIEGWIGKRISIKSEQVEAFGETVDALRVKKVIPPTTTQVDYSAQIAKLRACKTIDELAATYKAFTGPEQVGTMTVKDEMKLKLTAK